jgi:hypothetical protein
LAQEGEAIVAIRITAVRLEGGEAHEHIVRLWWINPANSQTGDNSRAELVSWIENQHGKAYVEDAQGNRADVGVVTPTYGAKYLRTHADGKWTDNLLALPRR